MDHRYDKRRRNKNNIIKQERWYTIMQNKIIREICMIYKNRIQKEVIVDMKIREKALFFFYNWEDRRAPNRRISFRWANLHLNGSPFFDKPTKIYIRTERRISLTHLTFQNSWLSLLRLIKNFCHFVHLDCPRKRKCLACVCQSVQDRFIYDAGGDEFYHFFFNTQSEACTLVHSVCA